MTFLCTTFNFHGYFLSFQLSPMALNHLQLVLTHPAPSPTSIKPTWSRNKGLLLTQNMKKNKSQLWIIYSQDYTLCVLYCGHIKTRELFIFLYFLPHIVWSLHKTKNLLLGIYAFDLNILYIQYSFLSLGSDKQHWREVCYCLLFLPTRVQNMRPKQSSHTFLTWSISTPAPFLFSTHSDRTLLLSKTSQSY